MGCMLVYVDLLHSHIDWWAEGGGTFDSFLSCIQGAL